jgi:hypothetical protein
VVVVVVVVVVVAEVLEEATCSWICAICGKKDLSNSAKEFGQQV